MMNLPAPANKMLNQSEMILPGFTYNPYKDAFTYHAYSTSDGSLYTCPHFLLMD
jgi:hypothetical protein